ncbi:3-keto-5-aminohexanoate cleavage protein [Haloarcula litorea]|uniref:3-keto-5-aminohexanoate cleavage protein n=1 Tax=Haloarcula litorea TaxID=3032579 RepID=UPI0023E7AD74|nr:3-keto-5-aminohexanoate cleavage protein [Halomicroarcula sp. GDY20]
MTYEDYIRGDEVILGVAPTGYRYGTETNEALPTTPDEVAKQVYESSSLGATLVHVHGRDDDGEPDPTRLPAFGGAIRDVCDDDVLLDYAADPSCPLGDFLDVLDREPRPAFATVRLSPTQYSYRETSSISRRDVDRFVGELQSRGIRPNLLVTSDSDVHELHRLRSAGVLSGTPLVTVKFGAPDGALGSPLHVRSVLEAVPDTAACVVRATGPNQYPLLAVAFFLGAHLTTGMEDNLFLGPETPVERNAQLVRQVAELVRSSIRPIADTATAGDLLAVDRASPDQSGGEVEDPEDARPE